MLIELNGVHELAMVSPMLDHSKIRKTPFWMIQIAKNQVFGHFLEFGALDWLDIAYFDRTNWCAWASHGIAHAGSFKNQKNAFLNDTNSQKMRFLANFLSLMAWIDMMLYILIDLNDLNDMTIVSLILDHSKIRKMPFWMIQIANNEVFSQFFELGSSDRLEIAYFDRNNWLA